MFPGEWTRSCVEMPENYIPTIESDGDSCGSLLFGSGTSAPFVEVKT